MRSKRVKPRKTVEMPDGQVISSRAYRTLLTLRKGRWMAVSTYVQRQPLCLQELLDAGYIMVAPRVARRVLCYVPVGTAELEPDQAERNKRWGLPADSTIVVGDSVSVVMDNKGRKV